MISGTATSGTGPLVLSLLLHCALLFSSPFPLTEVHPHIEGKKITLELLHSVRQRIRPQDQTASPGGGEVFSESQDMLAGMPGHLSEPSRIATGADADLNRVRAIRSAIYSRWDAGIPPGQGTALALLHIGRDGRLLQTWIKALQGEEFFQEYMQSFLGVLELPESSGEELWLECEFVVK